MHKFTITLLTLVLALSTSGQHLWQKKIYKPDYPWCIASPEVRKSFIPPPKEFINPLKSTENQSDIIVPYHNFPTEAKNAFEYATSIWESLIESPFPIYIDAIWTESEENVLGSCGPYDHKMNFEGARHKDIFYPIALAEKIIGTELTGPERPDMIAEFNENINWYFGTDGNTPTTEYDFVSVVLHEIAHGLGFTGFFNVLDQTGEYRLFDWGDASSFDYLVVNNDGEQLIDTTIFDNPSDELRRQLTSGFIFAYSPSAIASEPGTPPRLYAPIRWNEGSSIYHLNGATYPSDNINNLMTHSMGRGQATHHPGPVTLGILADIGWKNLKINHTMLKDMEVIKPLTIEAEIQSDYPLDLSQLYLVFSTDSFVMHVDSIPLESFGEDKFSGTMLINPNTPFVSYYISATDSLNRSFTNPAGAPKNFFTINFGPDDIAPVITHQPIDFFIETGFPLVLSTQVEDNLGVDTVYVEYAINGVPQQPFGLTPLSIIDYAGLFPVNNNQLNDNDEISYTIVAIDASSSKNTVIFPETGEISFIIEKIFDPVFSYSNDFEDESLRDFVLTDFSIEKPENFENSALHSPHPYPSTLQNETAFNLITLLKHPIILKEDAILTFDEIVLVEPGDEGSSFGDMEFWDYVIVEASKDSGATWLPLTNGYDSNEHETWENSYYHSVADMNSTTAGSPDLYINRQIDMLENGNFNVNDTILIRFRLYSDALAHGWGWAIDNIEIQTPITTSVPVLSPGKILVYPNPFRESFNLTINSERPIELLQMEIYSMHGQKIQSHEFKNTTGLVTSKISIKNNVPGIYLLIIKENGKQVLSKKIIHN